MLKVTEDLDEDFHHDSNYEGRGIREKVYRHLSQSGSFATLLGVSRYALML